MSALASRSCEPTWDSATRPLSHVAPDTIICGTSWAGGRLVILDKTPRCGVCPLPLCRPHTHCPPALTQNSQRTQRGLPTGVDRPTSKCYKCLTVIFMTWPKDRRRGVYVAPRPPDSFPGRELGPTTARRSLPGEISPRPPGRFTQCRQNVQSRQRAPGATMKADKAHNPTLSASTMLSCSHAIASCMKPTSLQKCKSHGGAGPCMPRGAGPCVYAH